MRFALTRLIALGTAALLATPMCAAEAVEVLVELAKLYLVDGQEEDRLGGSVSLSGDRLAVGAGGADGRDDETGAAFIFERMPSGEWLLAAKLLASDGALRDDFGHSISLSGDRVAIGAVASDDNNSDSGSAYVFDRDANGAWLETKLVPVDGAASDFFGESISLDGDRLAIGARSDDDNGLAAGSAYIFDRDPNGNWLLAAKLLAGGTGAQFGSSISLDGDRVVVGAPAWGNNNGRAWVFERNPDGDWLETAELRPFELTKAHFGESVSLEGDRIAIGSVETFHGPGLVYIFELAGAANWVEVARLQDADGVLYDEFGGSVSLEDDRIAIGVIGDDENGISSGSTFVFDRDAEGNWLQTERLLPRDGKAGAYFGHAVSLEGDSLAIGAVLDDANAAEAGSAYVFEAFVVSPQLFVSGTCPGEIEIAGSGVTPRDRMGLYRSENTGQHVLDSGPCVGTQIGLDAPQPVRFWNTDLDGAGALSRAVDEDVCGDYLQLVDERTCLVSEVVPVPLF